MAKNNEFIDQRGSASIEASISLTLFIFFIITIYSFVNFCRAQALIQTAINESAKEISQYSYLYKITGLQKYEILLNHKADESTTKTDKVIDSMGQLYDTFSSIASSNLTPGEIDASTFSDIKQQTSDLSNNIEVLMSDPKGLMMGFAALAGQKIIEEGKSQLVAELAKTLSLKNIELKNVQNKEIIQNADDRLKSLGIENGLAGLDFSNSTIFPNGSSDINITVQYSVKILQLLPVKSEAVFCQTASTRGWLYGDVPPSTQ